MTKHNDNKQDAAEEVDVTAGDGKMELNRDREVGSEMMVDTGEADDGLMEDREKGFDAVFRWQGKPLLPYTSSREALFLRIRKAMGAPPLRSVFSDFSTFLGDAHVILWLCSTPEVSARDEKGNKISDGLIDLMGDVQGMVASVMRWADENVPRDEGSAAANLALDIHLAAQINAAEAVPDDDPREDNELGN